MAIDIFKPSDQKVDEKIRVLEIGYTQVASEFKHSENLEHKVTITVSTLVIALAGFLVKGEFKPDLTARIALAAFCLIFTVLAAVFLYMNGKKKRLLVADILRVEQILGLFEPNNFISEDYVKKQNGRPHEEATVFVTKGLESGQRDQHWTTRLHMIAVVAAGVAAVVALLFL